MSSINSPLCQQKKKEKYGSWYVILDQDSPSTQEGRRAWEEGIIPTVVSSAKAELGCRSGLKAKLELASHLMVPNSNTLSCIA